MDQSILFFSNGYNNLGDIKMIIGDYEGAIEDYKKALELRRELFGTDTEEYKTSLKLMEEALSKSALNAFNSKEDGEAFGKLLLAKEQLERANNIENINYIDILLHLARLYNKKGDINNAIDSYKFCLVIIHRLENEDTELLISTLKELGQMLKDLNRPLEAIEYYSELALLKSNISEYGSEYADSLAETGDIYVMSDKYQEAVAMFKKAKEIYEKNNDSYSSIDMDLKIAEIKYFNGN